MRPGFVALVSVVLVLAGAPSAWAQELAKGTVLDDVRCAEDQTESYALYVPTTYAPERQSTVLMAFHPAARGRAMVDIYRAAAEQYGYIVAGSNTSRNGPWAVSLKALQAMSTDLGRRFAIDTRRVYLAGMSGGARVAMQVALGSNAIAGVIASSAGFPDSQPRPTVPFAVFGTAGTEDFNYLEMRQLDRRLTSPHRLAIFTGGHTLPPETVATEAIEWLELQAMIARIRPRDDSLIDRLLEKRRRAIDSADGVATVHQLQAFITDFKGLREVSPEETRVATLAKVSDIRKALAREPNDDAAEQRVLDEVFELEQRLKDSDLRFESLNRLRKRLEQVSHAATESAASPERDRARRVLSAVGAGVRTRIDDAEYLKLIEQYRRRP